MKQLGFGTMDLLFSIANIKCTVLARALTHLRFVFFVLQQGDCNFLVLDQLW